MPSQAVDALIARCLEHAGPLRDSPVHGEQHWMRVALIGARLCVQEPEADRELVLMFALLHDSRRESEWTDPEHGPRAPALARELNRSILGLDDARLHRLTGILHDHNGGAPSAEPTRAVCFDADRLNLWRVGIEPDPALLSLACSREPLWREAGRRLQGEPVDWARVAAAYRGFR